MSLTSKGVTDEARSIAITLTFGEQKLLQRLYEMWNLGVNGEGFGFGATVRGGQHRCANRLVKLGLAEWESGRDFESEDTREHWFPILLEPKLPLVREVLCALGRLQTELEPAGGEA